MKKNMITKLPYQAFLSFSLEMPSYKDGNEVILQKLQEFSNHQDNRNNLFLHGVKTDENGAIVLTYSSTPFANLFFKEILAITDNAIAFSYEEQTDQKVMLPNIFSFVQMLMMSVKAFDEICCGFHIQKVICRIRIKNNTDSYFYEKYSPLMVDYSRILKYSLITKNEIAFEIKSRDDVYFLFNGFYQQYTSTNSLEKPFITVVKDNFYQVYNEL